MGLTSWLSQVTRWFQASGPNTITTSQELAEALRWAGIETSAGVQVNMSNTTGLAAVAVCVRVLSSDVSQLPLVLSRRNGDGLDPAKERKLYKVLYEQPNGWQASYQFRKLMMRDLLLTGNAFARIYRDIHDEVFQLVRLNPASISITQNLDLTLSYEYTDPSGRLRKINQGDVFHLWNESSDGVVGLNPIQIHRETIGDAFAIRQHGSRFFKNGAFIRGILEMVAGTKIGPDPAKAMLDDFNELYTGSENAHKTALLPGGVSYKPISVNMQDAQWIETRKKTDRDIYGIFGVPPHKGGDLDQAAVRANVENENISYVQSSLMPWLICWEQCIKRDLLGNNDEFVVKHNVDGLLRGDAAGRAAFYKTMVELGVMNPNEVRAKENINPREDDGGNAFASVGASNAQPPPGQESPNAKP